MTQTIDSEARREPVIVTTALARWYGPVVGITDVNVRVPPGIVGLLGPNGAGKSTLMRILTGQINPSSGDARVLGEIPWASKDLFMRLGYCSEDDVVYEDLTAWQTVEFLARCAGYGASEARDRTELSLRRTGILDAAHRRAGGFSKGMRQRTRLAAALVHDPELVLLDEPMTGLDPLGRRAVMDIVFELGNAGKSVVFASHILHEVEAVAQHVVVINKGMVLAEGTLQEIQADLRDYSFNLEIRCSEPRLLAERLIGRPHVRSVAILDEDGVRVATDAAHTLMVQVPVLALDLNIEIHEVRAPDQNLEALFQRLIR